MLWNQSTALLNELFWLEFFKMGQIIIRKWNLFACETQIMCFMEVELIKELPGQGKMSYFIILYFFPFLLGKN